MQSMWIAVYPKEVYLPEHCPALEWADSLGSEFFDTRGARTDVEHSAFRNASEKLDTVNCRLPTPDS